MPSLGEMHSTVGTLSDAKLSHCERGIKILTLMQKAWQQKDGCLNEFRYPASSASAADDIVWDGHAAMMLKYLEPWNSSLI